MNKKKKTNTSKRKTIIIALLSVITISCLTYVSIQTLKRIKNKSIYDKIYEEIEEDKATEELADINDSFIENVKSMQDENSDVKAWIKIDDTNINYPILQGNDNDYYLDHNYKKEKSSYGSIFLDNNSNIEDENSNLIIYGHDMKDGQMFMDLLKYQGKDYYEEHKSVQVYTNQEKFDYEIVCAFKSRIFYQDEVNVFRFYHTYNFGNEDAYNSYINNCKRLQLYETGIDASYGEQLITLITCEYSQENGRMVVVAKKLPK